MRKSYQPVKSDSWDARPNKIFDLFSGKLSSVSVIYLSIPDEDLFIVVPASLEVKDGILYWFGLPLFEPIKFDRSRNIISFLKEDFVWLEMTITDYGEVTKIHLSEGKNARKIYPFET